MVTTKRILTLIDVYLVCWVIAYMIVNGDLNITNMLDHFVLAWTFNSSFQILFTWIFSWLLFLPIPGVVCLMQRKNN